MYLRNLGVEKSTLSLHLCMLIATGLYLILIGTAFTATDIALIDLTAAPSYVRPIYFGFVLLTAIGLGRMLMLAALAISARTREDRRCAAVSDVSPGSNLPPVSVIIPCYNEERVIVPTIQSLLDSDYPNIEIIIIDDGSTDSTAGRVLSVFAEDTRVQLISKPNGGKASALNLGVRYAKADIVVALDADTHFERQTIPNLVKAFAQADVGAVAGNTRVGNRHSVLTRWQAVEYVTSQNLERLALAGSGAMMVVPGAAGAWRKQALVHAGGFPEDTLAEDQDLTIAIQRFGWRAVYEPRAIAWTEAPETFSDFSKQRLRWSFGTLQCLLKHRTIYSKHFVPGLALIAIPQAWVFQVLAALVSPLADVLVLAMMASLATQMVTGADLGELPSFVFFCLSIQLLIELICASIAYRLDRSVTGLPVLSYLTQRFAFRQVLYYAMLRALARLVLGGKVEWGKLKRSGRVEIAAL